MSESSPGHSEHGVTPEFQRVSRIDFLDINPGDTVRLRTGARSRSHIVEMAVHRVVVDGMDIHTQRPVKGKNDGLTVTITVSPGIDLIINTEKITSLTGRAVGESEAGLQNSSPSKEKRDVLSFDTTTDLQIHQPRTESLGRISKSLPLGRINTIEIHRATSPTHQ